MTDNQKQLIREMRGSGLGYKKIARELDLPLGTVQSFCRRENITAVEPIIHDKNHCCYCGKTLIQMEKVKKRKFCSDECRVRWWTEHPCSKSSDSKSFHVAVCENCGKTFSVYGNAPRKYCSHECYVDARFGDGAR